MDGCFSCKYKKKTSKVQKLNGVANQLVLVPREKAWFVSKMIVKPSVSLNGRLYCIHSER